MKIMMEADLNMWSKISISMHEGLDFPAAIKKIREDSLFWTREVLNKVNPDKQQQHPPQQQQYGAHQQTWQQQLRQQPYNRGGRGGRGQGGFGVRVSRYAA